MRNSNRWVVVFALLTISTTACQGIRLNSRNVVESAPEITVSQYEPESNEGCTSVGQATCDYITISFNTVQEVCAEKVSGEARSKGANYIWVNEPKQSVGGFATRSPVANFYDCSALTPR